MCSGNRREKADAANGSGVCEMEPITHKAAMPNETVCGVFALVCGISETKFDNEVKILTIIHATSNEMYQAEKYFFACG